MRRRHRTAHRCIWLLLAVLLPVVLVGAMTARRGGPIEAQPVQLAAPK